jgi:adenosylcobinamide amidohydrolase
VSPFVVARRDRLLVARFPEPQRAVSWAVAGGGLRSTRAVVWRQVDDCELGPQVDPVQFAQRALFEADAPEGVCLLTACDLDRRAEVDLCRAGVSVRCLATVGLGNALRAGDPPSAPPTAGTINILCAVSVALTDEALLEALAVAIEARTVAIVERGIASRVSGLAASGTGTDCAVVCAPQSGPRHAYAGKHTLIGHLIGAAALAAVARGAQQCAAR